MDKGFGFGMDRGETAMMFTCSLISILSTSCVLFALVMQRSFRNKQSSLVLFNLFSSQFLTSLGSLMGVPVDQSFACWFEGIVTNVFTLSSLFWAVVISWMLFEIVGGKEGRVNLTICAVICYGIPLLVTLLPLINSTYGSPPPTYVGWCWVVDTKDTPAWAPTLWYWLNYYGWVWLCFVIIFGLVVATGIRYVRLQFHTKTSSAFRSTLLSLMGYPIAIIVAWFPATCQDFYDYEKPNVEYPEWVLNFADACACFMGTFCAITYFSNPTNRKMFVQTMIHQSHQPQFVGMGRTESTLRPPVLDPARQSSMQQPNLARGGAREFAVVFF
eukprot:c25342_g1_i1.p1 GENE.c25342_g1_i1~~c25342_g1_i1.p1  ORF type:complete len:329 (+),score=42.95 c25342_g1_i1:52-1038(+)